MKRLFLASVFMLVFPIASQSQTMQMTRFSQLALGGGYEAVLLISNKTNSAWSGTVWLSRGFSESWQGQWAVNGKNFSGTSSIPVTLPAKGMVKLRITGDSTTRAGYLDVAPGIGSDMVDVAISYFYEVRAGGVLKDTTGSSPSAFGLRFYFAVEKSSTVDTGIAWSPTTSYISQFPIYLTLYDQDGVVARAVVHMFFGHEAQFISQLFPNLPSTFTGHLEIESEDYLYVEVLRMETTPTGFQLTSTPADSFPP